MKIKIAVKNIMLDAELFDTETAKSIADELPIEAEPKEWGDENDIFRDRAPACHIEHVAGSYYNAIELITLFQQRSRNVFSIDHVLLQ